MQRAPSHVNCLDPAGAGVLDRLEIAVAHQEVILDDVSKNPQRKDKAGEEAVFLVAHPERQPFPVDAEMQNVRPLESSQKSEAVFLDQVEKRGLAFVLDPWTQPDARVFLKNDVLDPLAVAADG